MSPRFDVPSRHETHDDAHYCARCLAPVGSRDRTCGACDQPFEGTGRFQRLPGRPPTSGDWMHALRGEWAREAA